MKHFIALACLALGVAATTPCQALMSLGLMTPEKAKAMGVTVKAVPSGPKVLRVTVSFPAKNALQDYHRTELRIGEDNDIKLMTQLHHERDASDQISLQFLVARTEVARVRLWIVAEHSIRTRIGYVMDMKDFIEPNPQD